MANTPLPAYIQNSKQVSVAVLDAATNVATNAVGGTIVLATGGLNGSVVFDIAAIPRATPTAANVINLYASDNNGVASTIRDSVGIAVTAVTVTGAAPRYAFTNWTKENPLFLAPNQQLRVAAGTAFAAGIIVSATQGDY